jgi:uncharacterized membrane protein
MGTAIRFVIGAIFLCWVLVATIAGAALFVTEMLKWPLFSQIFSLPMFLTLLIGIRQTMNTVAHFVASGTQEVNQSRSFQ